MKKFALLAICLFCAMPFAATAQAHSLALSCLDNGDATVTCDAEFSDGSSAAGCEVRVNNEKGDIVTSGKIDQDGEYSFKKPEGAYVVTLDGGEGHSIQLDGKKIVQ